MFSPYMKDGFVTHWLPRGCCNDGGRRENLADG